MTKGGRIFGGIFTLIAAGIVLLVAWVMFAITIDNPTIFPLWFFISTIAVGVLGLIGGILLIKDITAGGILTVIAGTLSTIQLIIWFFPVMNEPIVVLFMPIFFTPAIMMLIGGIVGLSVRKEI